MGLKDRLKQFQENYDQDKKNTGGGDRWEAVPGVYNGIVEWAKVAESKKGNLGLQILFAIAEGDHAGQRYFCWGGLESEGSRRLWLSFVRQMGVELPDDICDLEDAVSEWGERHPRIRFQLKQNGEFMNFKPVKVLDIESDPDDIPERPDEAPADTRDEDHEDGEELKVGDKVEVSGKGKGVVLDINEEACLAEIQLDGASEGEWFDGALLQIIQ